MKNLSFGARIKRYSIIKPGILELVMQSYQLTQTAKTKRGRIIDKSFFYTDLINCFGVYDEDFILYNLFYEEEFLEIINFMDPKDFIKIKKKNENSYIVDFFIYLNREVKKRKKSKNFLIVNYLRNLLPGSLENLFQLSFRNEKSIIFSYSNHLVDKLSCHTINWKEILIIDALFSKLWNTYPYFKEDTVLKKLYIFEHLENKFSLNLNTYIKNSTDHLKSIFSSDILASIRFYIPDIKLGKINILPKNESLIKDIEEIILDSSYFRLLEYINALNLNQLKRIDYQLTYYLLNKIEYDFLKKKSYC